MIQGIGNTTNPYINNQNTAKTKQHDVHNMSLNDAKSIANEMYKKGEISLREMLPFIKPITAEIKDSLEKELGHEINFKYHGDLWDNPDKKIDLLSAFKSIFEEQRKDGAMTDSTQDAISFLEKLKTTKDEKTESSSFEDFLKA